MGCDGGDQRINVTRKLVTDAGKASSIVSARQLPGQACLAYSRRRLRPHSKSPPVSSTNPTAIVSKLDEVFSAASGLRDFPGRTIAKKFERFDRRAACSRVLDVHSAAART